MQEDKNRGKILFTWYQYGCKFRFSYFLKSMIVICFGPSHNIQEPVLGQPFGYSTNHYSKSLLMKDFIIFLSSYAHSFIATYAFASL
jgi:hypothetical protein